MSSEITKTSEVSGLIIMTTENSSDVGSTITSVSISCLDVETGKKQLLSTFPYETTLLSDGYYATRKEWFNNDYSLMACTKAVGDSGETHAGWIDTNGTFFDVTEALGLQSKNAFSNPAHYQAIGFTEDGYFAYCEIPTEAVLKSECKYYYLPLSTISKDAIIEGLPFPNSEPYGLRGSEDLTNYTGSLYTSCYKVTDWIDEQTCIVNIDATYSATTSTIINITTQEQSDYIPASSRSNWNGVLSPNKDRIAFMSSSDGTTPPDVFIISISGGEPIKISSDIAFANQDSCKKGFVSNVSTESYTFPFCNMLIDWK